MANHDKVITKKNMTKNKVLSLIKNLNDNYCYECLTIIDYDNKSNYFEIVVDEEHDINKIQCWLNNKNSFELREIYAGNFSYWIIQLILDNIAKEFYGFIRCDAFSDDFLTFNTPNSFEEYQDKLFNEKKFYYQIFIKN